MAKSKKSKASKASGNSNIARNKKAGFDYFIEEHYEAGIVLEGWEVKSMRAGQIHIKESYVFIKDGEAFISGVHITPLISASTHISPHTTRVRKLLLNRKEINKLMGLVDRKGYTLIATSMYWKKGKAKVDVGLGKGKKDHDKRNVGKERDWQIEKARIFKNG